MKPINVVILLATFGLLSLACGPADRAPGSGNPASFQTGGEVPINQTQTGDDVEVTLIAIKTVPEGLGLEYSHRPLSDTVIAQLGSGTIVKSDGTRLEAFKSEQPDERREIGIVRWDQSNTGAAESVNVELGPFVVFDSTMAGSTEITLGPVDSQAVRSELDATLTVGSMQYDVVELVIDRGSPRRNFILLVYPANEAARRGELVSVSGKAQLSDDIGNSYTSILRETRWGRDENGGHEVAWQQLRFAGEPAIEASQLNLTVEGAGVVVGPFVFEDVALP